MTMNRDVARAHRQLIGALIQAERERRGITRAELAAALNLSTMQIWRYETGKAPLQAERLIEIAQVIGVSPRSLIPAANAASPPPTAETPAERKPAKSTAPIEPSLKSPTLQHRLRSAFAALRSPHQEETR